MRKVSSVDCRVWTGMQNIRNVVQNHRGEGRCWEEGAETSDLPAVLAMDGLASHLRSRGVRQR